MFQGCGESSRVSSERESSRPATARAAEADPSASRYTSQDSRTALKDFAFAGVPAEPYQAEDNLPPGLTELFHDPNPSVRIQALDAWTRQPGASLDFVTYALVDPDESVRARAQELFEQELTRR